MFGISTEILSLLGSSLLGFGLKIYGLKVQAEKDRFDRLMTAIDKADASADKAALRSNDDNGRWIRRFIVIVVLSSVCLFPLLMAILHEPTVIQSTVTKGSFLGFGGGTKEIFTEIRGLIMVPEMRAAVLSIVGFYFGTAAAKSTS